MSSIAMDRPEQALEQTPDFAPGMLDKLFGAAQSSAVFGAPVSAEGYTVITACEVGAGGGFGSGRGSGPAPVGKGETGQVMQSEGGGTGGGGGAMGRPIAAIVIGPDGVKVKPITDVTKIALAGITAWGAMLLAFFRLRAKVMRG